MENITYLNLFMFFCIGIGATTIGSLIGLGGGFLIMPMLLFVYPEAPKASLTAISLCVIFVNALFSTFGYFKQDKVKMSAGVALLIATFPGAAYGSIATSVIAPETFNKLMGLLLGIIGISLLFKKEPKIEQERIQMNITMPKLILIGTPLSFITGFISSFFGIGGGIMNMPILIHILHFPVKYAVATSMFIILVMATTGTVVHIIQGSIKLSCVPILIVMCIGAIIGGTIGTQFSKKINSKIILILLALCLIITGLKLVL